MKKIYQNPTTKVITLKPMLIIAASLPTGDSEYSSGDPVLSRRGEIDFDDFDEEY